MQRMHWMLETCTNKISIRKQRAVLILLLLPSCATLIDGKRERNPQTRSFGAAARFENLPTRMGLFRHILQRRWHILICISQKGGNQYENRTRASSLTARRKNAAGYRRFGFSLGSANTHTQRPLTKGRNRCSVAFPFTEGLASDIMIELV